MFSSTMGEERQHSSHGRTEAALRLPEVVPTNMVTTMEVMLAIESLYADEIRPFGRILRKRLAERATAAGRKAVEVDAKYLRALCEVCPSLLLTNEESGEWSALLQGRAMTFVDAYSPVDVYPAELWQGAAAYFGSLEGESMVLPGGRYSCAQALVARGLPFLEGCSLGQVSHIVQLAISQKKLLGYLNGAVVPYNRSQSMLKEQCARRQRPCANAFKGGSGFATMDMIRALLQELFQKLPQTGSIPLSNIKRLVRSRFHVDLSETALGYAKLSELLQDPSLRDICAVRLQGHGYVVCPSEPCNISLFDTLCPTSQAGATTMTQVATAAFQPCAGQFVMGEVAIFAQPVDAGYVAPGIYDTRQGHPLVANCVQVAGYCGLPHGLENTTTISGSAILQGRGHRVTPLCLEEISPKVVYPTMLPSTPSPSSRAVGAVGQLPRLLGSPHNTGAPMLRSSAKAPKDHQLQQILGSSVASIMAGEVEYARPCFQKAKSEPAVRLGDTACEEVEESATMPPMLVTPSTRSMLSVQNTFLHFNVPLSSPCMAGSCRRRSRSQ
jgi:hypothetical protein